MKKFKLLVNFLRKYWAMVCLVLLSLVLAITLFKGAYGYAGAGVLILLFGILITHILENDSKNNEKKFFEKIVGKISIIWKLAITVFVLTGLIYLIPKVFDDSYYVRISDLPKKLVDKGYTKSTIETMFSENLDLINNGEASKLTTNKKDNIKVEFLGNSLYLDEFNLVLRKLFKKEKLITINIGLDSANIIRNARVISNGNVYPVPSREYKYYSKNLYSQMQSIAFTTAYDALVYVDAPKIVTYYASNAIEDLKSLEYLMKNGEFYLEPWFNKLNKEEKFDVIVNYSSVLLHHKEFKSAKRSLNKVPEIIENLEWKKRNKDLLIEWHYQMIAIGDAETSIKTINNLELNDRSLHNYLLGYYNIINGNEEKGIAAWEQISNLDSEIIDLEYVNNQIGFIRFLMNDFDSAIKNIDVSYFKGNRVLLSLIKDFKGATIEESKILELEFEEYDTNIKDLTQRALKENKNNNYINKNYQISYYNAFMRMFGSENEPELDLLYNSMKAQGKNSIYLNLLSALKLVYLNETKSNKRFNELISKTNSEYVKFVFLSNNRFTENYYSIDSLRFNSEFLEEYKKLVVKEAKEELTFSDMENFYELDFKNENLNNKKSLVLFDFFRSIDDLELKSQEGIEKFLKAFEILEKSNNGRLVDYIAFASRLEKYDHDADADIIYNKARMLSNSSELSKPLDILIAEQNQKDFIFGKAIERYFKNYKPEYGSNIAEYKYVKELATSYILDKAYAKLECNIDSEAYLKSKDFIGHNKYFQLRSYCEFSSDLTAEVYEVEALKWLEAKNMNKATYFFKLLFEITYELKIMTQKEMAIIYQNDSDLKTMFQGFKNKIKYHGDYSNPNRFNNYRQYVWKKPNYFCLAPEQLSY